ncbi:hypothetical protein MMC29_001838 [Sticta canariensis]|nr:hypothetical protein [Sticta canariensis]
MEQERRAEKKRAKGLFERQLVSMQEELSSMRESQNRSRGAPVQTSTADAALWITGIVATAAAVTIAGPAMAAAAAVAVGAVAVASVADSGSRAIESNSWTEAFNRTMDAHERANVRGLPSYRQRPMEALT